MRLSVRDPRWLGIHARRLPNHHRQFSIPAVRALQLEHRSSPIGEQCVPLSGCIEPRLAPPVVLEPGLADLLVDVYLHKDSASGTVGFP